MSEGKSRGAGVIDTARILRDLPHRYPFLLIDRIVDYVPDEGAVGVKNVTINEQFFQGHFPGNPIMPGVLIVEALCQTAGVVVVETLGMSEGFTNTVYFMSIESAKFRKPVVPGDQLRLQVVKERNHGKVWRFSGIAWVDGAKVAEATFTAMVVTKSEDKAAKSL